jgi:epoxyqueuosine reductase
MLEKQKTVHLGKEILQKAKNFGADLVGIASVADIQGSPSHIISEKMPEFDNVAVKKVEGRRHGQVDWPVSAKSAIVVAVSHPEDKPELDNWILGGKSTAGNTPGNKKLISIITRIVDWLEREKKVRCFNMPYHIELGGIYMKDAAVLAGLGCIGMNNILVTPQFGPRQRLKVMLVDVELEPTGPIDFDPCADCEMPCRRSCPKKAFAEVIYTPEQYGQEILPGRNGVFNRLLCSELMDELAEKFEPIEIEGQDEPGKKVTFCRECELSCPVGRKS